MPADRLVRVRIEVLEREILELLPHLLDAHAARQGRVDVEGLLGDPELRFSGGMNWSVRML